MLGVEASAQGGHGEALHVQIRPAPHYALQSRPHVALLVGILEGALTTALRRKMQVQGDPRVSAKGVLELEFNG